MTTSKAVPASFQGVLADDCIEQLEVQCISEHNCKKKCRVDSGQVALHAVEFVLCSSVAPANRITDVMLML